MDPNYTALSASDGSGEPVRATVQSPGRSPGSTAIPVNATTNWPAGTFIATTGTLQSNGTLNPTTVQVFYGTASGTTVTITSFAAGYTDLGNAEGDTVVIKPTTEWANIVSKGLQSSAQFPSQFANFVEPAGGIWSISSGLIGASTAGDVWYSGARSAMASVASHTFTASKDTYIDFNPSTSGFTYVAATNGAVEPAVTASSVRVAKVITGSSAITSISQGAYSKPVPLVWKYLTSVTALSTFSTASSSPTQVTSFTLPATIPTGVTQVRASISGGFLTTSVASKNIYLTIWRGTPGSGTLVASYQATSVNANTAFPINLFGLDTPSAGSQTYNLAVAADSGGNIFVNGSSGQGPLNFVLDYC